MNTRDLGTHIVELHEHGMLTIAGEGTRLNLPAHEALDLLKWLQQQQQKLTMAIQHHPAGETPLLDDVGTDEGDRDLPVDEP